MVKVLASAPRLERDASKEDEIEFLRWCQEQVADKDLYLSSFFSSNLVGEIEHRIRGDLDTDLHPYYLASLSARSNQEQAVAQARSEYVAALKARDEKIAALEERVAAVVCSNEALVARIKLDDEYLEGLDKRLVSAEGKLGIISELARRAWFGGKSISADDLREVLHHEKD